MRAYDPAAGEAAARADARARRAPRPYEASAGADVVALLTEWEEFRWLDFERVRDAMRGAGDRRRPQPARPGRDAPAGLRVQAGSGRPLDEPDRGHGRRRLRRLASLRRVARTRRRGRRGRQPLHEPPRERRAPRRPPGLRARASPTSCNEIPVDGRVDGVLHLASPASPPEYLAMPLETLDVSSLGTRRALDLALANDAPFLLASTSEIYGDPARAPAAESVQRQRRPDRAARGLRRGEALRRDAHDDVPPRSTTCRRAIVRIFNTYGPRLRPADGRVVSNFLVQAIDGQAAHRCTAPARRPDRSASSPTRCAASSRCSTPTSCEPVNIGNPIEFTMLELADARVRGRRRRSPSSCSSRCPIGDPTRRQPDITARPRRSSAGSRRSSCAKVSTRTHAWYLEERARGRA